MRAETTNHYAYNNNLRHFANDLRKDMTKSESCLWKYALKAGLMKGYQFRRQRPVLNYIADFMCLPLRLVIEADGFTHQSEEQVLKDEQRDSALKNAGFTILRFTDAEILHDMNNVKRTIESKIEEMEEEFKRTSIAIPTPYPRQRGTALNNPLSVNNPLDNNKTT